MDTSRIGQMTPETKLNVDKVMHVLNQQRNHVNSVLFLENFNKDTDMSLFLNKDIFKGVVVSLKDDYKLSEKDSSFRKDSCSYLIFA